MQTTIKFDTLMNKAIESGNYDSLNLDANNDISLELLSDGETAVVFCRNRGEIARFNLESYFTDGHWSDLDIDNAIHFLAEFG